MYGSHDPQWLSFLSRRMRWLAIPHIAYGFIAFQVIGFFFVTSSPAVWDQLVLLPELVFQGQIWRLISFLTLPLSLSIIGILFTLAFSFFILNSIENQWGSFKTTLYVLSSIVFTIVFSLLTGYPITSVSAFVATWFLAAATLFPENQIHLYMVLPVKLKYLGWLATGFLLLELIRGTWMDRLYLLTVYTNYLLFFGPYLKYQFTEWRRKRQYRSQFR